MKKAAAHGAVETDAPGPAAEPVPWLVSDLKGRDYCIVYCRVWFGARAFAMPATKLDQSEIIVKEISESNVRLLLQEHGSSLLVHHVDTIGREING